MDFVFEKVITNNGDKVFVGPDLVRLSRTFVSVDDNITLPIHKRKGVLTIPEMGGKNPEYSSSIATIITGKGGKLLDAIYFNKYIKEQPNGSQAFIELKEGCKVYVGKISTHENPLSPAIKFIVLTYQGRNTSKAKNKQDPSAIYCDFKVSKVITSYSTIADDIPANRLVKKLFTDFVVKPYYANGWSASDVSKIKDKGIIIDTFHKLMSNGDTVEDIANGSDYLDAVEDTVVEHSSISKLSAVLQVFDFNTNKMELLVVKNLRLNKINDSIRNTECIKRFSTDIDTFFETSYNLSPVFGNKEVLGLKIALSYDRQYTITLADNVFGLIRAYRG